MHIYYLSKMTVKKRILNIKLMNGPVTRQHKAKHSTNSSRFNVRAKSLIIINTELLKATICNQLCLISVEATISMVFMLK